MTEHDDDGYTGAATLLVGEAEFAIEVTLRGHFQPIDGYYHWYGRISANSQLSAVVGSKRADVRITTPDGAADGQISDVDPWGRFRIAGTSRPPFRMPTSLEEIASELQP